MARYKPYDYDQLIMVPVSLEGQLMPGTLEFAIHHVVDNDLCPLVSPDGKYLFYTRRTDDGYGVFWLDASFISWLRPEGGR